MSLLERPAPRSRPSFKSVGPGDRMTTLPPWKRRSNREPIQTRIGPCAWPDVLKYCKRDTAPRLYEWLARRVDETQLTTIDYAQAAQELGISKRACARAAQRLAQWHLIRRVALGGGRGRRTLWRVTLLPIRNAKRFSQKRPQKEDFQGSIHGLTAMNDTVPGVSQTNRSPTKGQMSAEPWRKAIMSKARTALAEIDVPDAHKDALIRLFGRGVWHARWPVSVARRVLWALPALAQSERAPPPDAPIRRVYAAFASLMKPSIEAGWDMFQSWLNYLRPAAGLKAADGWRTELNSRGQGAGGGGGSAGWLEEVAPCGSGREVERWLTGSTSGRTGERRFTSGCLASPRWGGNPPGGGCPMERATGQWRSTSAARGCPGSLPAPSSNWMPVCSPPIAGSGSSSCMPRENESGTMSSASDCGTLSDFEEWLRAEYPFRWMLILGDPVKRAIALHEWRRRTTKPEA